MVEVSPSTIERDIAELEKRLQEKKAALEHEKSDKELLHEVVGEKIQEHIPQYLPAAGQTSPSLPTSQAPTPIAIEPPSYLSQELKDKIQEIVKLVFDKNLDEGIKEAVKSGNIAFIDAFHDILVDELYDQLIEKRKLDKVE
ncbi:MAG: hypothetical protein Q8R55_03670 [Candidatus Taylorbacteria bacterium]|nr:hypothetical protein [Candidatus Taylorbacteria bacterium]